MSKKKLTKSRLRQLVREEIQNVLSEDDSFDIRNFMKRFTKKLDQLGVHDIRAPRENELELDGELIELEPGDRTRSGRFPIYLRGMGGDRFEKVLVDPNNPEQGAKLVYDKLVE